MKTDDEVMLLPIMHYSNSMSGVEACRNHFAVLRNASFNRLDKRTSGRVVRDFDGTENCPIVKSRAFRFFVASSWVEGEKFERRCISQGC